MNETKFDWHFEFEQKGAITHMQLFDKTVSEAYAIATDAGWKPRKWWYFNRLNTVLMKEAK